jgi:protein involved in polysaccharide export with SLBB domain
LSQDTEKILLSKINKRLLFEMKMHIKFSRKLLLAAVFLSITGISTAQTAPSSQGTGSNTSQAASSNQAAAANQGTALSNTATLSGLSDTNQLQNLPPVGLQAPQPKTVLERVFGYNLFSTVKLAAISTTANIITPNNYVLGSGDELVIDITNVDGYSQQLETVTVNRDGNITVPKAGLIYVGGSSILQAKRKIAAALGKFYGGISISARGGSTTLNLSLGQPRSITVQILGEVNAPGTYSVTSLTSMMNALYLSGGPNEIGTFRKVNLVRNNEIAATLDLYDVLTKGFSPSDVLLRDQDVIQVGTFASRMAVEGNVKRPGLFELLPGQRLIDLVNYAGGFGPNAYSKQLKVYRNTTREKSIVNINKIDFDAFEMNDGDSLVVDQVLNRFENLITIQGAVFRPGDFSLDNNPTLLRLIESAEGFQEDALIGRITILRSNELLEFVNIPVNVRSIMDGTTEDIKLRREDQVIVPSIFSLNELSTVRIQGAVNNPLVLDGGIGLAYVKGLTLKDVLIEAGGLKESASLGRVEVARRKRNVDPNSLDATISDIYYFDIDPNLNFAAGGSEFELRPYDEIFVRTSPNYVAQTFATIEGEVLFPSNYALRSKDEKISDLIARAGNLSPLAFVEGATLIRRIQLSEQEIKLRQETLLDIQKGAQSNEVVNTEEIDPTEMEAIGINLKKILANPGSKDDMILIDGDVVRIPKRLETVRVQGEVLYPTSVRYQDNKNFIDYISESGGFNKKAQKSLAYVLYPNGSVDRTRRFLFVNIYPDIEPGSEIIIPRRTVNTQQKIAQTNSLVSTITASVTGLLTLFTLLQFRN